jgi:hypothetical protein
MAVTLCMTRTTKSTQQAHARAEPNLKGLHRSCLLGIKIGANKQRGAGILLGERVACVQSGSKQTSTGHGTNMSPAYAEEHACRRLSLVGYVAYARREPCRGQYNVENPVATLMKTMLRAVRLTVKNGNERNGHKQTREQERS